MPFGAGMSNLKSDQSVDSVAAHSVTAPSEARLLEVSEVPRICITRSLNGRVGSTSLQQCSGPSPIPIITPSPQQNRHVETTPRQNVPAQDCSKQAILRSAPSDTSLVLYPRDPKFGQILSGRSNSFHPDTFWPENRGSFDKSSLHG